MPKLQICLISTNLPGAISVSDVLTAQTANSAIAAERVWYILADECPAMPTGVFVQCEHREGFCTDRGLALHGAVSRTLRESHSDSVSAHQQQSSLDDLSHCSVWSQQWQSTSHKVQLYCYPDANTCLPLQLQQAGLRHSSTAIGLSNWAGALLTGCGCAQSGCQLLYWHR